MPPNSIPGGGGIKKRRRCLTIFQSEGHGSMQVQSLQSKWRELGSTPCPASQGFDQSTVAEMSRSPIIFPFLRAADV